MKKPYIYADEVRYFGIGLEKRQPTKTQKILRSLMPQTEEQEVESMILDQEKKLHELLLALDKNNPGGNCAFFEIREIADLLKKAIRANWKAQNKINGY